MSTPPNGLPDQAADAARLARRVQLAVDGVPLLEEDTGRLPAWALPQAQVPGLPADAVGVSVAPLVDGLVPAEHLPPQQDPVHVGAQFADGSYLDVTSAGLVWVDGDGVPHVIVPAPARTPAETEETL